ncbi:MAG: signal peptide peptidase SppA [Gemmatimonadales bacterium]|nr:MAG: signal peptide peptidase SppA [Gemmatimonadales bacterium]
MTRFLLLALATIGGVVLLGFFFLVVVSLALFSPGERLPGSFVLELDLTRGVVETVSDDPFALAFARGRPTVRDIVGTLERAAGDDRVEGLRVIGGSGVGGWATTQEIHGAVTRFRASGKPTLLFAETFGELAPAQGAYFLATAFDEIVLQPSGEVGLAGLALEAPFFRGVFERWDIVPQFESRGEYKDAAEIFENTGFSPPVREALEAVLVSIRDELVGGISGGRGISADSAGALLAAGPFSARQALDAGLVDRLGYRDEARAALDARVRNGERPDGAAPGDAADRAASDLAPADSVAAVSFGRYADAAGTGWNRGTRIALVHGSGAIQRGDSPGFDPLGGGTGMGANAVARALRQAASDPDTRAILFRVDSPGGSYVASDIIRREVIRARERGIPVVVSMGNAAASGGYLISADADRIIAHPTTLTGSIGVVAGKFVVDDFLRSLGVSVDKVDLGDDHGFYSAMGDLSPADAAWLSRQVDRIYEDFVDIVAEGRGMDRAAVDAVARGRVWSGRDALAAGLVDDLGGFDVALAHARELAGLEPDADLELRRFPAERTLFEVLMSEFRGGEVRSAAGDAGGPATGMFASGARVVRGAARVLWALGADDGAAGVQTRMLPLRIPGN